MKCEARVCHNEATHVYIWQTDRMPAPAFWYGCEREAMDWFINGDRPARIIGRVRLVRP